MAITITRILGGSARVFTGVTPGATGTPPTYIAHTDGVPGSGTDVGATEGDAIFTYKLSKKLLDAEQELGHVDVMAVAEEATIAYQCKEVNYVAMQVAMDNCGKESVAGGDAFYFGGGTGILAPTKQCVMLTARQRSAPTKFTIAVLYNAVSMDGTKLAFKKAGETMYQVTLQGILLLTRNAGDRLGYWRFET